jgi:ankyrin repeat protein
MQKDDMSRYDESEVNVPDTFISPANGRPSCCYGVFSGYSRLIWSDLRERIRMSRRVVLVGMLTTMLFASGGCGAFGARWGGGGPRGLKPPYQGVQYDLKSWNEGDPFGGILLMDVPASFVVDTCLLPFDLAWLLLPNSDAMHEQVRFGRTPLIQASAEGKTDVVKSLLEKGADINALDGDGWTAMREASRNGHTEVVRLLLEKGADISTHDGDGWTALSLAAGGGRTEVVKLLLERGADVNAQTWNGTALHSAAERGHTEIVKLLLEKGADVNARSKYNNQTALIRASFNGRMDVVKLLLNEGADVYAQDNYGGTAIAEAKKTGQPDIVLLLEKAGTKKPDAVASNKIAKSARVSGADAWDKNSQLIQAVARGNVQAIQIALTNGADVNTKTNDGRMTVLMWAVSNDDMNVVRFLLENGADVNLKGTAFGDTALMIALRHSGGKTEVIESLVAKGADVNARDVRGWTALMMASMGDKKVVELLLEAKADVNVKANWEGRYHTALSIANETGRKDIVALLEKAGAKE